MFHHFGQEQYKNSILHICARPSWVDKQEWVSMDGFVSATLPGVPGWRRRARSSCRHPRRAPQASKSRVLGPVPFPAIWPNPHRTIITSLSSLLPKWSLSPIFLFVTANNNIQIIIHISTKLTHRRPKIQPPKCEKKQTYRRPKVQPPKCETY